MLKLGTCVEFTSPLNGGVFRGIICGYPGEEDTYEVKHGRQIYPMMTSDFTVLHGPCDEEIAELEAINARKDEIIAMLKRAAPPLTRLWVSSTDLLARFEAHPTIKQAVDRMMSEVAEFIVAANDTYGASTADIAEEAADVCVTVINVLRAANVSDSVFYEGLETVMASNDKKTDKTHQRSAQNGVERLPEVNHG